MSVFNTAVGVAAQGQTKLDLAAISAEKVSHFSMGDVHTERPDTAVLVRKLLRSSMCDAILVRFGRCSKTGRLIGSGGGGGNTCWLGWDGPALCDERVELGGADAVLGQPVHHREQSERLGSLVR